MVHFCRAIVRFTASLESPYFRDTYSFEGVAPEIRRMKPDDVPRGKLPQVGEDRGRLPQLASLRGGNMNTEHWLPHCWSTLQGLCGHTLLKVEYH
jgi:hypothetical protein